MRNGLIGWTAYNKVFGVLLKFEWVSFCHIDQLLSVN